jgi:sodium transport system ATP-binding protein
MIDAPTALGEAPAVLVAQDLHKRFGDVVAVERVDLEVRAGEVVGLLGPNGAGKTTTLRMLAAVSTPDGGRASVLGHDTVGAPLEAKARLGFLTGQTALYARLTPREVLAYFGALHGMPRDRVRARTDELIRELGMGTFADRACQKLSSGEKQRANIARTLLHDPPALVLDEPTSSLDIVSGGFILDFIRRAKVAGKAVLFSTHVMAEAELLCDRVHLLHRGRILTHGSVAEICALAGANGLAAAFLALIAREDAQTGVGGPAGAT